ncbi:MAG TPA: phosphoglucomutase [Prolixibacteraceae bacterium]|nr:phosphoglucomutase [Prolixibacteraceae bacterium]
MNNNELLRQVEERARLWLSPFYDEATRKEVQRMLDNDNKTELIDSFYKDLEFGTGGLRGVMGAGTNRMNIYTVGAATQGLSDYLKESFAHLPEIKVVIGHDCRNNSRLFAETCAGIFAANGIRALLFEDLRPTPEMSYAIREYGCQSGIILTASHNPPEYNGYKAYWDDGAQLVAPHDEAIIELVKSMKHESILFDGPQELIKPLGEETDLKFIEMVKTISLSPDLVKKYHDIKIVYTPIHGTGVKIVPMALRAFGFTNIINVPEQDVVSGNFPTVVSPNPEEPAAMKMAIEKALEVNADVVMATDPDSDRLGVATRNLKGEFVIINGNQTALLFIYYIITKMKENGALKGNEFIVKTIVSTELITEIARKNHVDYFDVYTGFKYIAEVIRENEGIRKYIGGGEESFGFLPADFVRDKDAVSSIAMMAEIVTWAMSKGKTLYELLMDIYLEYGFSREKTISVTRKGQSGAQEIQQMMTRFRTNPPRKIGGTPVHLLKDYELLVQTDLLTGETTAIDQKTTSNVLQFFTTGGTKISIRPSGTEPKIKFYFEVHDQLKSYEDLESVESSIDSRIDAIVNELGL